MSIPTIQPTDSSSILMPIVAGLRTGQDSGLSLPRVLHVINGEHYSGAERVQDLLAERLPECGFEVGFVCVKPGKFPVTRQSRKASLVEMPMRTKFDLRVVRRVARLVRDQGYSLIHAHTPRSAMIARAAAALSHVPMVYHVHSPTSRDTTHRLRNRLNQWIEQLSLFRVAALVTVSASLRQHMLAQGYPANRVFTVPNGVPAPEVHRSAAPPRGTWTVGMTALFRPRKGLEVLLESLAILNRERFPVRLLAVGPFETPDYERTIHDLVRRLGMGDRIQWTGFTPNVATELTKMDLFVLPSLFGEGLPMVVLEAMATGVPVIATRIEGVPEAIEHGISGLIAEPNDPVDLAHWIRSAIRGESNWSALRQGALLRHSTEFSDGRMAGRLADVYRRILG